MRARGKLRLALIIDWNARLRVFNERITIMLLLLLQLNGARVVIKGDINVKNLHAEFYLCNFR
jgi:hypothetical protein